MAHEIKFDELTLKDALDFAVLIEDEAQERYEEFSHQMEQHHTPESARFFRFMAKNEAKHGDDLRRKRESIFGSEPSRIDPSMLVDVEAPEYEKAAAFMSPREALQVAYEAEVKAFQFFDSALDHVTDPAVRELFEELRQEEVEHQTLVKQEIAKLPSDPGFDPDDFVDEPVAQ